MTIQLATEHSVMPIGRFNGGDANGGSEESQAIAAPTVEIVVPVYNEEAILDASITRLARYLAERFPLTTACGTTRCPWTGSTTRTPRSMCPRRFAHLPR